MMEISVFIGAVVWQLCTPVKPIGSWTLNGCSFLYLNFTAVEREKI